MANALVPDFDPNGWTPAGGSGITLNPLTGALSGPGMTQAAANDLVAAQNIAAGQGGVGDYARTAANVVGRVGNRLVSMADPRNLIKMAVSGATLPGDVASGKTQVMDPTTGDVSDEAVQRSLDLTGLMSGGSFAKAPAEAEVLGSGPVRTAPKFDMSGYQVKQGESFGDGSPGWFHVTDATGQRVPGSVTSSTEEAANAYLRSKSFQATAQAAAARSGAFVPSFPKSAPFSRTMFHGYTGDPVSEVAKWNGSAYLAFDHDTASSYADSSMSTTAGKVDKYKVNLQNPLSVSSEPQLAYLQKMSGADKASDPWEGEKILNEWAQDQGHDGIVFQPNKDPTEEYDWTGHYNGPQAVVFNPKKSMQLNATSDKSTAAVIAGSHEPFYSAASRAVDALPLKSASAEQWAATLKNQPGVRGEELANIEPWLQSKAGQPVTKDEIKAQIAQTTPQIKEVVHSAENMSQDDAEDARNFLESEGVDHNDMNDVQAIHRAQREGWNPEYMREAGAGAPKYSEYQLPGGENYREVLMTLPENTASKYRVFDAAGKMNTENINSLGQAQRILQKELPGGRIEEYQSGFGGEAGNYQSSHWDEPNVLAHLRLNDRDIPDAAGNPQHTLFAEEMQSDWHQAGRKNGYKTPQTAQVGDRSLPVVPQHGVVPDAPFKKSWPELLLKRLVSEAANKGYDQVAWTDGATQAARYDLSKQVSEIVYDKENGHLQAWDLKGNNVLSNKGVVPEKLPDYIGKDAADKLLNTTPKGTSHVLAGDGLKVGGEGMKGFYDDILPKAANKLFGKLGGKVEKTPVKMTPEGPRPQLGDSELEQQVHQKVLEDLRKSWNRYDGKRNYPEGHVGSDEDFLKFLDTPDGRSRYDFADAWHWNQIKKKTEKGPKQDSFIHVLKITPQLRDHVRKNGLPLFSSGVPLSGPATVPSNDASQNVNRSFDVPAFAGSSKDGSTVYIDRRVPRSLNIDGKVIDPAKYLSVHERTENMLMTHGGMPYEDAHHAATQAERQALEADGVDWKSYEAHVNGMLRTIEQEKVQKPPPDLYLKPYHAPGWGNEAEKLNPSHARHLDRRDPAVSSSGRIKLTPVGHDPFARTK